MKRRKKKRRKIIRIKPPDKCFFCVEEKDPDYKDYKGIRQFLSDRAKIIGKDRSGICSKHQRKLSKAIKRARHLGLLPFAQSIK